MKTIEELDSAIATGGFDEFVQITEAKYDKQLVEIAAQITARPETRLVLIAGPSSSGKTTTAMHLKYHLAANGIRPLVLSTDDYFVGDARNPRDESGNLDYEHIEAMDIPRLNADLAGLLEGREVHLRNFDFATKTGFDDATPTRLASDEVIVMEGLHCLNPRLTADIPAEWKFLLYVRLLPRLSFADKTRISTTDIRLLRRIVRDNLFRNTTATETIGFWPVVRRGEERWIFPFECNANAVFNSAIDYEVPVLKPIVEKLLNGAKSAKGGKNGAPLSADDEAVIDRLLAFLARFREAPASAVPSDSLLREYIGGSSLAY